MVLSERKKSEIGKLADATYESLIALAKRSPLDEAPVSKLGRKGSAKKAHS
jgi:hypothetical protein